MVSSCPFRGGSATAALFLLFLGTSPAFNSTAAQAAQASLFTPVATVQVTPTGYCQNGDFARLAYVPGRSNLVVTFGTRLSQPDGGCTDVGYAYKDYTTSLEATGQAGVISCHAMIDTGGLFVGDDFYLASAENQSGVEGWYLTKFSTNPWASSVEKWYPFPDSKMMGGDPMVAYVNGQIDFSSVYESGGMWLATHHNLFTTDLQSSTVRLLSDTTHFGFNSIITQGGFIWFLSSTGANGDLIVMKYDPSWNFVTSKMIKENAMTPMGVVFDGTRFYVAHTTQERTNGGFPICENVRLAAFDTNWDIVDDIALTNFTLADQTSAIHPALALKDGRLFVAYSQNTPAGGIETLQVYVKAFDISTAPICSSFTISPISASPSGSAGSQQVTLTGSPSGCVGGAWTTSGNGSWLTVSPSSGTEPGTVTASWTANTVASPRSATATIAGNTFSVSQDGGLPVLTATRAYSSIAGATVDVSWTNPGSATSFVLERATNLGGFTPYASVSDTSYTDNLGFSAPASTLLYRVRESGSSQYSNVDYTTIVFFTDDPLVGGTTMVKAVHLTELRQAIDAMRSAANLPAATWTDSSPSGVEVKAAHMTELRNAVTAAVSAISGTTLSFTDSTLASGHTIKAAHFQELRTAVK